MPIDITKNLIRIRQKDPALFQKDSMRTVDLSKDQGIKSVMGKKIGSDTMEIQSYLFDKEKWTEARAKKWVKDHDGTLSASEEAITQFFEETSVSEDTATKILGILYQKGEGAEDLNRLLWKMQMFLQKNALPDLMNKMSAAQIGTLVDEMIAEDEMNRDACGPACCSEKKVTVWGFSEMGSEFSDKTFTAGDKVEIQIMRTGKWDHPMYGEINITPETLTDVKKNFDDQARGIDLAVDENHEGNHKALGWFRELTKKGKDSLFATIELTKKGAELLSEGAYKYFSPEIVFNKQDEESGKSIKNLLIGGAFTNRPFFKAMQPLLASEGGGQFQAADHHQSHEGFNDSDSNILFFNTSTSMKKILELIAQFCDKATITADEKATLEAAFSEMAAEDKTEALTAAVEEIKAKFSEEGADAATAADGAGADDTASTEDKGDPASAVTTETETAADPAKVEGETTTDPAPAAVEPEKVVEANEKGEVTIQASEYQSLKALASQTAKLVSAARKSSLDQAVSGLVFSESNKVGVALPKNKQEIVDFALSLSEKGAEKFLAILGKLQTVAASEVGHSEDTANFAEENAEKVAFFMEKMGFSKDEAIKAVQDASAIKDGQK